MLIKITSHNGELNIKGEVNISNDARHLRCTIGKRQIRDVETNFDFRKKLKL